MELDNLATTPSTEPVPTLSVGDTIEAVSMSHPVTVLAGTLLAPAGDGTYPWWVVLCHLPHNGRHPFAVWNAYQRPEGWSFANGNYSATLGEAWQAYTARGGE